MIRLSGTQSRRPGGTRAKPEMGASPVAVMYRPISKLARHCRIMATVISQPMPTKPDLPMVRGPRIHSPLPMAAPSPMRLGPTA